MMVDLCAMKSMMRKIKAINGEDVKWAIGKGVIHGSYVDPAHVALLDMTMKYETGMKVSGYDLKPVVLAINIASLYWRTHFLPAGDARKADDPENKLKIDITMDDGKATGMVFSHPMLRFTKQLVDEAEISDVKTPHGVLDVDATANINTRQFKLFLRMAEAEAQYITFVADRKKNKLNADFSNDYGETVTTDLTYSLGGIEGIDLQFLKTVSRAKALFSVDYMMNIVGLINAPTIKVGLKDDNPLVVWWKEKDNLEGIYFLAPRIGND